MIKLNFILFAMILMVFKISQANSLTKGKYVKIEIQIDGPFSPFKTLQEERQFAIKNDHAKGTLNPLPEVLIQIDKKDVFKQQLAPAGNRMTHIHFGKATAEIPADNKEFTIRVVVESQNIDYTEKISVSTGRFLVITSLKKDPKVAIKQYKTKPLYR